MPRWYPAPHIPGFAVFPLGRPLGVAIGVFVAVTVVFLGIWWLNRRAATRLDAMLAAIPR